MAGTRMSMKEISARQPSVGHGRLDATPEEETPDPGAVVLTTTIVREPDTALRALRRRAA